MLCRQVFADLRLCVSNEVATYRTANVPRRCHCAAARDCVFVDFADDAFYPMVYLGKINSRKQGEFKAEALASKLNQLFALYKTARKRAALDFKRHPHQVLILQR